MEGFMYGQQMKQQDLQAKKTEQEMQVIEMQKQKLAEERQFKMGQAEAFKTGGYSKAIKHAAESGDTDGAMAMQKLSQDIDNSVIQNNNLKTQGGILDDTRLQTINERRAKMAMLLVKVPPEERQKLLDTPEYAKEFPDMRQPDPDRIKAIIYKGAPNDYVYRKQEKAYEAQSQVLKLHEDRQAALEGKVGADSQVIADIDAELSKTRQEAVKAEAEALEAKAKVGKTEYDKEKTIRDDYITKSQTFLAKQTTFTETQSLLQQIKKDPKNAIHHHQLVVKYFKMIEPGSAVFQGEFETVESARGASQEMKMLFEKTKSGGFLSEDQIKNIESSISAGYKGSQQDQEFRTGLYKDMAKRQGLKEDSAVPSLINSAASPEGPEAAVQSTLKNQTFQALKTNGYDPNKAMAMWKQRYPKMTEEQLMQKYLDSQGAAK